MEKTELKRSIKLAETAHTFSSRTALKADRTCPPHNRSTDHSVEMGGHSVGGISPKGEYKRVGDDAKEDAAVYNSCNNSMIASPRYGRPFGQWHLCKREDAEKRTRRRRRAERGTIH